MSVATLDKYCKTHGLILYGVERREHTQTACEVVDVDLKANPAVSYWLKGAIEALENRDILDAVADAKLLSDIMQARYTALTGRVYGAKI